MFKKVFICVAVFIGMTGQAFAACADINTVTGADGLVVSFTDARTATASVLGAQDGRLVYDAAAKALKFCDGEDWVSLMVEGGAFNASGSAGAVQFKDDDGKLAGADGIFYNNATRTLNMYGAEQTHDAIPILAVSNNATGRITLKLEHTGSNFIVRPFVAGGTRTVIENTGGGALLINPTIGNVGVGVTNATEKLHVDGNIQIAAGGALKMDVLRISANPRTTPVSITPSGTGITCAHTTGSNAHTSCTCPAGYMAISGGGHIGPGIGYIRESRHASSSVSWLTSCVTTAHAATACYSVEITCIRIIPN